MLLNFHRLDTSTFYVAFVFASITVWYMFGEKLHRWKETREKKGEINRGYKPKYN
jgi:hypothetical protein